MSPFSMNYKKTGINKLKLAQDNQIHIKKTPLIDGVWSCGLSGEISKDFMLEGFKQNI